MNKAPPVENGFLSELAMVIANVKFHFRKHIDNGPDCNNYVVL